MAITFMAGTRDLVIVLHEDNLERLQGADPFELDMRKMGAMVLAMPLRIHVCYERSDDPRMKEFIEKHDMHGLLKYLARGFKMTADDHDDNYKVVATMKGDKP